MLLLAGQADEAAELGAAAISSATAKGDVTGARRMRQRLGEVGVPVP